MLPRNVINNAILSNTNASPMKAGVSDGTSGFSSGRMLFSNTTNVKPNNDDYMKKKWMGSKDSSSRTQKLSYQAIGKGSFNKAGEDNSFVNTKDINVTKSALTRVRASGYVVPPKVTNKM